jgi:hypothetical protein
MALSIRSDEMTDTRDSVLTVAYWRSNLLAALTYGVSERGVVAAERALFGLLKSSGASI